MSFELVIRSWVDENYRHVVGRKNTEAELERAEMGANRNLGEDYYTAIEEVPDGSSTDN